jgi:hypothetical protein
LPAFSAESATLSHPSDLLPLLGARVLDTPVSRLVEPGHDLDRSRSLAGRFSIFFNAMHPSF